MLLEIRRNNFNILMSHYQNIRYALSLSLSLLSLNVLFRYAVTSAVEARMIETQRVSEHVAKRGSRRPSMEVLVEGTPDLSNLLVTLVVPPSNSK